MMPIRYDDAHLEKATLETLKPLALDRLSVSCRSSHLNASQARHSSKPVPRSCFYWSRYQGQSINAIPNAAQSGSFTMIGDCPRLSIPLSLHVMSETTLPFPSRGCQEYINTSFEGAQRLVLPLDKGLWRAYFSWVREGRELQSFQTRA